MKTRAKWYTEKVAKKVNEQWTLEDRLFLEGLRERNFSVAKCYHCSTPLTSKEMQSRKQGQILFLCTKCRKAAAAMKKERREKFLKSDLCGVCGKRPHLPNKTSCRGCLSASQRRRIAEGLCGTCGKRKIDKKHSIHQCTVCLEINRLNRQESRI